MYDLPSARKRAEGGCHEGVIVGDTKPYLVYRTKSRVSQRWKSVVRPVAITNSALRSR